MLLKKKISKYIIDDIEISDEENSDEERCVEENSNEENSDEENYKNTRIVKLFLKHVIQLIKCF